MAIVYTYPKTTNIEETDLFILSKMNLDGRPTKSVAASDLAAFLAPLIPSGGVQGSGTTSTLPIWTDGPNGVLGDSVIRQAPAGATTTVEIIPSDGGGNSTTFTLGSGGTLQADKTGIAGSFEFRCEDGGFYTQTFRYESRLAVGRNSISPNVTLDVGTSTDPIPAAWFRNGVVVSNNPSGVQVDNTSMVIGAGNNDIVSGSDNCLAVGNNNQILADSDHSLAVGQGNTMTNADNSIAVGQRNELTGNRLYVLGFENELTCASAFALGGSNRITGTQNNFAIGYNNNVSGPQKNITIGTSNIISNNAGVGYEQATIIGNNCILSTPNTGTSTQYGMVVIGNNNAQNYPGPTSGQPFRPKIVLAADTGSAQKDALVISEGLNGIASMLHSDALLEHNFVDDTAAAAGGVPVGALYHNAGEVRIRVV